MNRRDNMVKAEMSISLDGYAAGPNQSKENPLGEGGERLHDWVLATEAWRRQHGRPGGERGADSELIERSTEGVGAFVMGRGMFGGGPGEWDESWTGWWGEDPPFHAPGVRAHQPPPRAAGDAGRYHVHLRDRRHRGRAGTGARRGRRARRVRRSAAPPRWTSTSPPACSTSCTCTSSRSCSAAGGGCSRTPGDPTLEPIEVVASPAVTHIRYRVD